MPLKEMTSVELCILIWNKVCSFVEAVTSLQIMSERECVYSLEKVFTDLERSTI